MGDAADWAYDQALVPSDDFYYGDEEKTLQGTIQQAQHSKSGKTLSVLVNDQWYSTKHFELQNMIGQEITAQTSESEFNGKVMHWLNDYSPTNATTTPAGQVFDQAHAQAPPMGSPAPPSYLPADGRGDPGTPQPSPQTASVDKNASITALALTKCIQNIQTTEAAFQAYKNLYYMAIEWNPGDRDDSMPY